MDQATPVVLSLEKWMIVLCQLPFRLWIQGVGAKSPFLWLTTGARNGNKPKNPLFTA